MSIRRRFGGLGLGMGMGGGVALFNPVDLNPVAWYDFSDAALLFTDAGVTPVSSDGDAIYQVNDKTTNAYNLTQSTLTKRGLYKTGIQNGLSVGRCDGVDDFWQDIFGVTLTQPNTVVTVYKLPTAGTNDILIDGIAGARHVFATGPSNTNMSSFAGLQIVSVSSSALGDNIATCIYNGATSTIHKNGVLAASGDTGVESLTGLTLGSSSTGTLAAAADMLEIIVFNYELSSTGRQNLETFLNNKWGIF